MKWAQRTETSSWWRKSAGQPIILVEEYPRKVTATFFSSVYSFIPEGERSPRMGSIQWFVCLLKSMWAPPHAKKKVWVVGHHFLNTSRRGSVSLNMPQLLEIRMNQWMPAFRRLSQNSGSRISKSTQWDQSLDATQGNSKLMETGQISPFWINRLEIYSRHGTQARSTMTSGPVTV